jgi:hypothetical protein
MYKHCALLSISWDVCDGRLRKLLTEKEKGRLLPNFIVFKIYFFFFVLLFSIGTSYTQVRSIGSRDSAQNNNRYYENQYVSPLYGKNVDFFFGDSIKGKNQYAAVHTYLVKDFNSDGFSDLFLSFFTGGEVEKIPFKLFIYDTLRGMMLERSDLIKNNSGQPFNRKSMAADLNGDKIPDIVCVSHPECMTCDLSFFDILFSDASTKNWTQKTLKVSSRMKGEGYYHGVALGDVDNDGDNDIVLANENTSSGGTTTMLNNGKGEFTEQISMQIFDPCCFKNGVSWTNELADLNKDGYLDLLYWHDSTYRGIAYGDGSGYFGRVIEQRFPKSKFSLTMDFDPVDLDRDGDLDLILTTTDYNTGWELAFYENKGIDTNKKVIWQDRSTEINSSLRSTGFYSSEETRNWLPYIQVIDLNNDGFIDIIPQRPLSNGETPWIIYGQSQWVFSYLQLNIPEIPTKPVYKKLNHETTSMTWPRYTIKHPRSSKRIKSWNIYFANKFFGDRSMVKDKPISVSLLNYNQVKDSVAFEFKFPYPKTFIRITAIDSSGLETPFSDIDSIFCSAPPKPVITWNGTELTTSQGLSQYQWFINDTLISGVSSYNYKPQASGSYRVIVKNVSGCADSSNIYNLVFTSLGTIPQQNNNLILYPNPASNHITLDIRKRPTRPIMVKLYDIKGKLLNSWNFITQSSSINLEKYSSGKYILKVFGEKIQTIMFIKH